MIIAPTTPSAEVVHIPVEQLQPLAEIDTIVPAEPLADLSLLKAVIEEAGEVKEPLVILPDRRTVYMGRARLLIAREIGLFDVPCVIRDTADAVGDACDEAIARRSLTPSQRDFVVFCRHQDVIMGRAGRGGGRNSPRGELTTVKALADFYGARQENLLILADLRKRLSAASWSEARRLVWFGRADGERGTSINRLAPALAGQSVDRGGRSATQVFKQLESGQLDFNDGLFPRSITSIRNCFEFFEGDKRIQAPMTSLVIELVHAMPKPLADAVAQALQSRRGK